jgi:hypothetical protein
MSSGAARQLAAEVFLLGFPLLLMDMVRRAHPVTPFRFLRIPDNAEFFLPGLVEDDPLTVKTSAHIDLGDGPVTAHLPDLGGRYFVLTLFDSAGEPFASFSPRTLKATGAEIALVGPRWRGELAAGTDARRSPSEAVWAVCRITARSPADIARVEELAAQQRLTATADDGDEPAGAVLATLELADGSPGSQVAGLGPETLLHRLPLLLERAPVETRDRVGSAVIARLRRLGEPFDPDGWSGELRHALRSGFGDAFAAIAAAFDEDPGEPGSWRSVGRVTSSADQSPLSRAAAALAFLGAPLSDDVLSLACLADESGRGLNGGEHYRIHFNAGGLPPAQAGWRLSAPHAPSRVVGLPSGSIGDLSPVTIGPDGSLDILIGPEPPDHDHGVNWLRSPTGDFLLTIQLRWPHPSALNGAWRMPPVERLGSRFARRPVSRPTPPLTGSGSGPRSLGPAV